MSINKKITSGIFWALLEKLGQQGLSFVVFLILARILGPAQFGLVNLCYVYITISYFLISGATDGIVTLQIRDDRRLSTMFFTVMGLGGTLGAICFLSARPFAVFMKQPEIEPLLHWIALVPPLIAAQAVPYSIVMKSMDFRMFTIRTIIANVAGGATGIIMAFKGFGAYALIAQQIVMYVVTNLVIWPGCKWAPRLMYDRSALKEVMTPGMRTSSSYFLDFFDQQAPRVIIGSIIGVVAVGHYSLVTRIRQATYDVLIHPMTVVLYPAFAEIKDDYEKQQKVLDQIVAIIGALIFPAIAGTAAIAGLFVPVLFGDAWIPAVPVMQLLLFTGAAMPFVIVLRDVLRAHNKTSLYLKVQCVMVAINLALACGLAYFGLVIMSVGYVVMAVLSLLSYIEVLRRSTTINLWPSFIRLLLPIASSGLMALAVLSLERSPWHPANIWLHMGAAVVLGAAVYAGCVLVLMRRETRLLLDMVKKMRNRRKPAMIDAVASETET